MARKKLIAIIGGSAQTCKPKDLELADQLGKLLVENGFRIITGGYRGVMEAVSKGAKEAHNYQDGDIVGIISTINPSDANEYCDIVIATGMNYARNQIITASADIVIAIGGGTGTLSEIAFAWQLNKPILAFTIEGWSGELAGKTLDNKRQDKIIAINTPEDAIKKIKELIS
jgi:uncharacterized protein (TIGR00725 family)